MTSLLMFSIIKIRLDIVFSIMVAIWFAKNLSYTHIEIVKTIFYYIKRLIGLKIIYKR